MRARSMRRQRRDRGNRELRDLSLAGTDVVTVIDRRHADVSVARLAGSGGAQNHADDDIDLVIVDDDANLQFRR